MLPRASAACTPDAASSPKAEPPDSTMALIASTELCGSSRSVSRVPGAPPSTCTPATAGSSQSRAVTPDFSLVVGGVADAQAGDIGDQVARTGAEHHCVSTRHETRSVETEGAVGVLGEIALVVEANRPDRSREVMRGEQFRQRLAGGLCRRCRRPGDLDRRIGGQRITFWQ